MTEQKTYIHSWRCPNCCAHNTENIPKGTTVSEADPRCRDCGCTVKQFWKDRE